MRVMGARISVGLLIGVCQVLFAAASLQAQDYTRGAKPPLFSYDELVQLGSGQELSSGIAEKLHVISTTPFINNEAYYLNNAQIPPSFDGPHGITTLIISAISSFELHLNPFLP
jgi:hypothetical protein